MGGIILGLLRGIGWIILILLLVFLALLVIVLFDPITYRICGEKTEDSLHGVVKVNWLFGLIRFRLTYEKELVLKLYVLWFDLFRKKRVAKLNESPVDGGAVSGSAGTEQGTEKAAPSAEEEDTANVRNAEENETTSSEADSSGNTDSSKQKETTRKKGFFQKLQELPGKIRDKIMGIRDTIVYYKDLLEDANTKALWKKGKVYLLRMLKAICPSNCKGYILYGTGSPDTTGYLYALYGVLSPKLGKYFSVQADFENAVLLGQVQVKGRIFLITLLVNGLSVLLMKELRIFIKQIKSRR